MKNILVFDVGGTLTKYGVIEESGKILFTDSFLTKKENCRITVPESIIKKTIEVKNKFNIGCIGISSAGQINCANGSVIYANDNLPDFTGCKLAGIIEHQTEVKTFAENDANCAVLGEMWQGAGKSFNYFVCLTLGTGVGGAVILNRKLLLGAHNAAAEFGRINGKSKILNTETVFDKTSSTCSLIERYRKLSGININGNELLERVKSADELAITAYNDFLESLADGLYNVTCCFDPEVIIIGGGISAQGSFLLDKLNTLYQQKIMSAHKSIKIIKAEQENNSGLLGAAYICLERNYYM